MARMCSRKNAPRSSPTSSQGLWQLFILSSHNRLTYFYSHTHTNTVLDLRECVRLRMTTTDNLPTIVGMVCKFKRSRSNSYGIHIRRQTRFIGISFSNRSAQDDYYKSSSLTKKFGPNYKNKMLKRTNAFWK